MGAQTYSQARSSGYTNLANLLAVLTSGQNPDTSAFALPVTFGSGSINVTATPGERGTFTDRSGTITTGGTSQQVMAANPNRQYLLIQNVSDTAMWIRFGAAATADQPSILLAASGGYYELGAGGGFVNTDAVHVMCATTGKSITAKEA